ncbi:hypothetical protein FNV43_RR19590 [Rhamnella rubrinervis]|uniref:DUF1985 domain-containing protein n=1 Tax=Rhamnella rubrinervis TaxID=2594499 RepID=A0A8K0E4T6_9ROSA|nr:hypothetical protein FNV43_RR19590 [Rhamnella rubrinervis]
MGAKFDKKSFAMITGLNCGEFPYEKELEHLPYDLWVKYLGNTEPMSQSDFSKAFEDLDFDGSNKEIENNVKCHIFYFLETVLLPGTRGEWKPPNDELDDEEEDELTEDVDWEKEMKDSPFDMYMCRLTTATNIGGQPRLISNAMTRDWFQCKNVKCLSVLFPYILMVHGYYNYYSDLRNERKYNLQPFFIKREDDSSDPYW